MLEAYLGEEDFRNGLKEYLNTYKYKNAKTEDLWRALEIKSGKKQLKIIKNNKKIKKIKKIK